MAVCRFQVKSTPSCFIAVFILSSLCVKPIPLRLPKSLLQLQEHWSRLLALYLRCMTNTDLCYTQQHSCDAPLCVYV